MPDEIEEVEEPRQLPETQYAYLCITGSGPSQSITEQLDIKPSKEWSEGDPWNRGHFTERFFTHWSLESGLLHTEDLNEHIRAILQKVRRKRAVLLELATQYDVKITCVSYDRQSFSFELDFDLQRELTNFGIRLWFDTYVANDPHTLIQDLRAQISRKIGTD